jgi:hypothetical protein
MHAFRSLVMSALVLLPAAAPRLQAQQNPPHIGYVYPAGGEKGTSFKVLVGGENLDGFAQVVVSGGGVTASLIEQTKPLTPKERNALREQLQQLQEKRRAVFGGPPGNGDSSRNLAGTGDSKKPAPGTPPVASETEAKRPVAPPVWTEDDEKMLADLRRKLMTNPRRPPNPAIAERVVLQVSLAPDAAPGERELRLVTRAGLTNPLVFQVGQLPEITAPEEPGGPAPVETRITLPVTVNGRIMPGAADRYRFTARQGQQMVMAVFARALIPYLADAVPGWCQATLALYDSNGKELAYDDEYHFDPDPVLSYKIPRDGEYVIEIKDALYRGREDFVYRVFVGELPFVTGIFPLGGQTGKPASVDLTGWNLPTRQMTPTVSAPGLQQLSLRPGTLVPNRISYLADALPDTLEQEPNDSPDTAQPVALPVIVSGRIDRPGDWDVFRFEGKAGQEIIAEVQARRLGSPLDSVLKVTDAAGRQLAFNDDHEDKGSGLITQHADSYLSVKLPASGAYLVHLGDTQHKGGPDYAYRLRLSEPRPDFELRVTPASLNVRSGGNVALTVWAIRRDGFNGEISLALAHAPDGFTLSGARLPANQDRVSVTMAAPTTSKQGIASLEISGQATIGGRRVTRAAVPAEDMMQAFAYRHLVPARQLLADVVGAAPGRLPLRIIGSTPVRIPVGGTGRIRVSVPTETRQARITLQLVEPPEGISLESVSPSFPGGSELLLRCDAAKAKPGLCGNLIVQAFAQRIQESKPGQPPPGNRPSVPIATLPAIPFEVVAP